MNTQKENLVGYAINTDYRRNLPDVPFDHTFVVSDSKDNFNCWGRGIEVLGQGTRQIATGSALAEWVRRINGTDPNHPSGLTQYVDGVCQNAANRLLLLAGTDVSAANANFLVILMYGKYGYGLSDFAAAVKNAADSINRDEPGTIPPGDIQAVLARLADDPSDELQILENHFQEALPKTLTATQITQLLTAYRQFQSDRQQIYSNIQPKRNDPNFQDEFAAALFPKLKSFLETCSTILGPATSAAVFKMLPAEAISFLLKTT
jgi:hypothetical protein